MKKSLSRRLLTTGAAIALACGIARAADYGGSYESPELSVVINPGGAGYTGEIRMGQQHFPINAHEQGNTLTGVFSSQGTDFPFTASLTGDGLKLSSGGNTYNLHKIAVNPLANLRPNPQHVPAPAPVAGQHGDDKALAEYTVARTTDIGKALVRQIQGNVSGRDAVLATIPDLTRYFGAKPKLLGAYEDQKEHKSTFVSFAAQQDGKPVKGFISARAAQQGESLLIVYGRSDAPPAEWAKLMAKPDAKGQAGDVRVEAQQVPLKQYNFPDGTGSVGVAEGWTTQAQTMGGAEIKGPADQTVTMATGASLVTPNNWMVQMGRQQGVPVAMLVAPYDPDPTRALGHIIAAINEMSQRKGGPGVRLDQIVRAWKMQAVLPGANAALILFDSTKAERGELKHYRCLIQLETYLINNDPTSWAFYATQLSAPPETFQKDLPVMLAQSMSLRENAAVIQQKTREWIDARNRQFEAMQAANREVQDAFDAKNRSWERNQVIQARSFDNFDEVIRGFRTVEDTRTGEKTSVDLGNVHDVVENLNTYDPGRYREIPLRDEADPWPANMQR